jgi:Fur family transcriptional regulator, ferric uptake regulator
MRRPTAHHNHLVCSKCGEVVDFAGYDLSKLEEQLCRDTGFKIDGHLPEVSGCCRNCSDLLVKVIFRRMKN